MKGILYGNFLLNKKWFIAAGITAVLGTAFCALWLKLVPDDTTGVPGVLFVGVQYAVITILIEWLGRNLEANIRCRFTDMTLAGGISRHTFVMSELLKNLISIGIGFVMCVIMQLVLSGFDNSFFSLDSVKNLAMLALLFGAIEWTVNPLIINLKSAEKAGLVTGLVLGFGVILPVMIACNIFDEENDSLFNSFIKVLSGGFAPLIVVAISAALYVIFYFALLGRVKKGDVC